MKNIIVSKNEMKFLLEETQLTSIKVALSESQIEELKDELGKLLQQIGLGKNYELTENGQIIENLIDKLDN